MPPRRQQAADLFDTTAAALAELRELTREAHGATKDLRAAIADARKLGAEIADAVTLAAHDAAAIEMSRSADHLQREMNRNAAALNRAVTAARAQIAKQLSAAYLEETPEGRLKVIFEAALFDAEIETGDVTEPPGEARDVLDLYARLAAAVAAAENAAAVAVAAVSAR